MALGAPGARAGSTSVYGAAKEAQPGAETREKRSRSVFPRRQVIQFSQPPIAPEQPAIIPPPLVTFRSAPELRAQYPPNTAAATVSEAFRQTFGKLTEFNFTLQGPDQELLIRKATSQALLSLAGRVYFLDRLILARDMLPRYFDQNGDRFVRRVHVSNQTFEAGQPKFDLQLIIDEDLLLKDMEEKRFIYRPKLRPFFFVFLEQVVNGKPDTEAQRGRKAIEDVLRDRNLRYADHGVPSMTNHDVDITANEEIFLEGRTAAQRNEIEVVLTGSLTARMTDLEVPVSEQDWAKHTLEVTVQSEALSEPVAAHLPLSDLLGKLDQALEARKAAGEREWWDVGSVEAEASIESLDLSGEERAALGESPLPLKALTPVGRLGLKRNYYTPLYYATARLGLKMVRIDNEEILGESSSEATASHEDRDQAIQKAIAQVVARSTNQLVDEFNRVWAKTVLDKADYKLLVSRVSEEDTENLADLLEEIDPGVEVRIRSILGDVAVLTVVFPGGRDRLINALTQLDHPRFRLVSADKKALAIEQI